ncbi:MAG: hypothetical protein OQL19_04105 [Gammaproteobacteria bacterium]|nr:hypothetical protein [Gammaproteobacteria bacterium]
MKKLLLFIFITFNLQAYACDKSNLSPVEAFKSADLIFSGKITNLRYLDEIEKSQVEPRIIVTFKTEQFWKGHKQEEVLLHTTHNKGSCNGFVFNAGEKYLVYAVKQKKADNFLAKLFAKKEATIGVKIYGGTKLLNEAKEEINNLNKRI